MYHQDGFLKDREGREAYLRGGGEGGLHVRKEIRGESGKAEHWFLFFVSDG